MPVRAAIQSDAPIIARIHVDTWRAAYRGQIPDKILDALDVGRRTAFWQNRLSDEEVDVFVSEDCGIVIGFCDLIPSRDEDADPSMVAEIAAIYVLPEHWRKGIGRDLCTQALAEARVRNYLSVTLWVLASNSLACSFYTALGFQLDGATKKERASDGAELSEVRYRFFF